MHGTCPSSNSPTPPPHHVTLSETACLLLFGKSHNNFELLSSVRAEYCVISYGAACQLMMMMMIFSFRRKKRNLMGLIMPIANEYDF